MIFASEKAEKNRRLFKWVVIGLFTTIILLGLIWLAAMVFVYKKIYWWLLSVIVCTIFLAYISGSIIRGKELHSLGLDLSKMDEAEIDVTIALLNKEKLKRTEKTNVYITKVKTGGKK